MLAIVFVNDGTGDIYEGNYDYKVFINKTCLAEGKLNGHDRRLGWKGLAQHFSDHIKDKVYKSYEDDDYVSKLLGFFDDPF